MALPQSSCLHSMSIQSLLNGGHVLALKQVEGQTAESRVFKGSWISPKTESKLNSTRGQQEFALARLTASERRVHAHHRRSARHVLLYPTRYFLLQQLTRHCPTRPDNWTIVPGWPASPTRVHNCPPALPSWQDIGTECENLRRHRRSVRESISGEVSFVPHS